MLLLLKKDPILSWCLKSLISAKYIWQSSNIRLSRRYEFDAQVASFGTWHGSQCRADPWKSEVIRANVALQALETKKNRKGLKKWYAGNLCSKQNLKNSDCATFCRIPFMLSYVEFRIAGGSMATENTSDVVLVCPPDRSPELSSRKQRRMPTRTRHRLTQGTWLSHLLSNEIYFSGFVWMLNWGTSITLDVRQFTQHSAFVTNDQATLGATSLHRPWCQPDEVPKTSTCWASKNKNMKRYPIWTRICEPVLVFLIWQTCTIK